MNDSVDLEALSARLHDIYQKEAHRRRDIRHADACLLYTSDAADE